MAREEAIAAYRDARRRMQARRDRAKQKAEADKRRELFAQLAKAGDLAGFDAWMSAEMERWDWVLASEEGPAKRHAFMRRAVALKRYRKEWTLALTLARHADAQRYERECREHGARCATGLARYEDTTEKAPRTEAWMTDFPVGVLLRDPVACMNMSARERFYSHLTL